MFTDIVKKNEYIFSPELVWEDSRYNNHAYYTNNVRMLVAIVLNNSKMFNQSISYFLTQMKLNETKSLNPDSKITSFPCPTILPTIRDINNTAKGGA